MKATLSGKSPVSTDEFRAPNDDGCVLGTAGREEDPNTTTDWQHPGDANDVLTPEDSRGMPGYPRDADDDSALSSPSSGDAGAAGSEKTKQDNDKVD